MSTKSTQTKQQEIDALYHQVKKLHRDITRLELEQEEALMNGEDLSGEARCTQPIANPVFQFCLVLTLGIMALFVVYVHDPYLDASKQTIGFDHEVTGGQCEKFHNAFEKCIAAERSGKGCFWNATCGTCEPISKKGTSLSC